MEKEEGVVPGKNGATAMVGPRRRNDSLPPCPSVPDARAPSTLGHGSVAS